MHLTKCDIVIFLCSHTYTYFYSFLIAFINITEATVREVLSSQILHATYQCRAIGFPLPLHITWRAEDNDEGNIIELTDTILGVEIINSIKNGQTVSELNLLNLDNVDFSSVACIVSNGYYPEVVQEQFLQENCMLCKEVQSNSFIRTP